MSTHSDSRFGIVDEWRWIILQQDRKLAAPPGADAGSIRQGWAATKECLSTAVRGEYHAEGVDSASGSHSRLLPSRFTRVLAAQASLRALT